MVVHWLVVDTQTLSRSALTPLPETGAGPHNPIRPVPTKVNFLSIVRHERRRPREAGWMDNAANYEATC